MVWEWVCWLLWYREEALTKCHFLRLGSLTEEQIWCSGLRSPCRRGGLGTVGGGDPRGEARGTYKTECPRSLGIPGTGSLKRRE